MRVIAGTARGRPLKAVPGMGTRPTTDKVKEALFSIIGPFFNGETVLDLFAGSGGLGIEALSRGAGQAVFVDLEKSSVDVVRENLRTSGLADRAEVYRNEAGRAVKALSKRELRFQLVFLDPPYRMKDADKRMAELGRLGLLQDGATIVVEHDAAHRYPEAFEGFACRRFAEYGDTAVAVYDYHAPLEPTTTTL